MALSSDEPLSGDRATLPVEASIDDARADESALWARLRRHGDIAAREALVARYLPYAKAQAATTYARRTHDAFEFEEYLQFAVVGLMESLERFDPAQGVQFKTFTTPRIVGAMLNGIERLSEQQQQIGLRRRLAAERAASLASEPLSDGSSQKLLRELGEIGVGIALGILLEGTGMLADQDEVLPDNAYSRVELRQLRQQIWHLVDHLTPREREVVRLHYQQLKSFDEVAAELGLTKGRVSQLHQQGLKRLHALVAKQARCDIAY
ncbi:sigma-70 family RNA polymerase sigma factor [Ralstonia pickettii]|uniref:sigma-70 family RNA polymerase sigma factor n=1 Tax=Ralstonia pickettii TaxID=329 RepID=UPI0015C199B2|nr:sigma-70 family RNA polymerase sigma factor [Ralstonia pickettii]NWK44751.1 sigma-70 family RNA polymerase sigma factor [Ralstonia pickettii]